MVTHERPTTSGPAATAPRLDLLGRDETDWAEAERFQLLVQGVKDYAIFMLDPHGYILTWNSGAQRLKQYLPSEIIGKHFSIFYPEEALRRRLPEHELEVATREGRYEEEGWRLRKDGTPFWANVVITALRDADGTLRGFAKVTRDLSERRKSDEQLRQSEARLRMLIDSVRDYAIFMLDPEGRVASWNPGAQSIKGYTRDEILGKHFSVFYQPDDVAAGKCDRELDIANADGRFEDEGWRVRKDGSRFWANVVLSAIRGDDGKLIGFAKVTRDLTERVRAEEERIRLAQAEEAVRLRDEFLSIASHELKTPLTSIQLQVSGLNRLLRKGVPDGEVLAKLAQRAQTLDHELDRMAELIEDLLDVSRAAAGQLHLDLADVDLSALVRDATARRQDDAAAAGSTLTVDAEEDIVGRVDATRVEQVLSNFLSNAMKYGAGKPIEVHLHRRHGDAILAVRDYGIGIAAADRPRIFERFARAVPASHYGGLGLGLWIVRLIVEAMGGSVAVESELGKGATFTATLPLAGLVRGR